MRISRTRAGFSVLEVVLFLGILLGTVMAVAISTEEARIRQRSIAEVEQRGTQLLETLTKNIHRAETILAPSVGSTGSILALQMALNGEFPTIFASTATGNLLFVQKNNIASLLGVRLLVSTLVFRNIGGTHVVVSFDLSTKIPLVKPVIYTRHFDVTATLFPDDQSEAGGCNSCPLPSCSNHQERWYHCDTDTCTLSPSTFSC